VVFQKRKAEDININFAPLIDIVFLLLIFFMVTSHFDIAAGVRIKLPKVSQKEDDADTVKKVILVIDKSGQIFLKGDRVELEAIENLIKKIVKEEGVSKMILQADKDVKHGRVIEIMDLSKSAGIESIIIAARWKDNRPD
jgi:biopolymer transport protein ExbD